MHLIFYARGVTHQFDVWKTLAQCQFFKWRRTNKETGEEEISLVQGALRPSVLGAYEYIFPKEALASVLSIFGVMTPSWGKGFKLATLRKMFGAKAIPKKIFKEVEKLPPTIVFNDMERGLSNCTLSGIAIHIIGIKEDKMGEMLDPIRNTTFLQEML